MQETWVRSLGQEVPLEKGMATHSSILARRVGRAQKSAFSQVSQGQREFKDPIVRPTTKGFHQTPAACKLRGKSATGHPKHQE